MIVIATIVANAFVGSFIFALWGLVELAASHILKDSTLSDLCYDLFKACLYASAAAGIIAIIFIVIPFIMYPIFVYIERNR